MSFGGGHRGVFGGRSGGGGGGEGGAINLNLTALMDILSNILFFLLASYTAQSVEAESQKGLHLPSSSSQVTLSPQVTITVTTSDVDVGGVPVAKIDHGLITEELDAEGKVTPLYERLRGVKAARVSAGRADLAEGDLVLLLADKGTDSKTITSILKTAGYAGFINVRFGVIAR
jgi:biopolymer transport protein ExbD